jgi:hypothetical protein
VAVAKQFDPPSKHGRLPGFADKPTLAEEMAALPPPVEKRKPGPKAPWQDFVCGKVSDQIKNTDVIPDNAAEVARSMLRLIEKKFHKEPDLPRLEKFIGELLRAARQRLAQQQVIPTGELLHSKRKPARKPKRKRR